MYDAAMKHRNITDQKPTSPHRQQSGTDQNADDIETRALFGPDGCGKTTHLGAIAGAPRHAMDGERNLFEDEDITGT